MTEIAIQLQQAKTPSGFYLERVELKLLRISADGNPLAVAAPHRQAVRIVDLMR